MANVDSLDIRVTSSATNATKALDSLLNTLNNLKSGVTKNNAAYDQLSKNLNNVAKSSGNATKSLTSTIAKLGITSGTVIGVVKSIRSLIDLSAEYTENLNLFSVSLGEYAQEAFEYAQQVQEIMAIDPSTWTRYQGVFMTLASGFGVATDKAYQMSTQLTQLGYDISSFFNLPIEEAMLKLQSGLSGELEPLRRIGYDLSVARLQQEAYNLGIEKSVSAMTQAEKAQLRYYAIMTQVTTVQGDMARTLEQPANQLRIFEANLQMAARAIGNIFIPALNAILPIGIAIVQVFTDIMNAIAALFGFEVVMPEYDTVGSIETGTGGIADNLDDANSSAKKLKNNLLGIDELNIISQDSGSSGIGDIAGGGSGLDIPLPEYDFLGDAMNERIAAIGTVIAGWRLADLIADLFGLDSSLLTLGDRLSVIAGLALTVGGGILYAQGAFDALENGVDWDNLLKMLTGIAGIGTGLYMVFKPFLGGTLSSVIGWFSAAAGAIGVLAISLRDIDENGMNVQNLVGSIGGLATAVITLNQGAKNLKTYLTNLKKPLQVFGKTLDTNVLAKMTDMIAPAAQVAGSLAIFSASFEDVIENGYSVENVLGMIAGGLGAIQGAVVLVNTAMSISPLFGGITLAVTLIGGLVSILSAVGNAMDDMAAKSEVDAERQAVWNQKMEEAKIAAENATTAVSNYQTSLTDLETMVSEMAAAQKLADEIYAIYDNTNRTNAETEIMQAKIEVLNGMNIDGLKLEYDELTGKMNLSRDAVQELMDKQLEMALQEKIIQQVADMYLQIEENARNAASVQQDIEDKLAEAATYVNENGKIAPWDRDNFEKSMADAETLYGQLQEIKNSTSTLSEGIDSYETMLSEAQSGTTSLKDSLLASFETVPEEMGQLGSDSAEGYVTAVKDGMSDEQWTTVANSLPEQMRSELGINSPSTVMYAIGQDTIAGLNNGINETASGTLMPTITTLAQNIMTWFNQAFMGGGMSTDGQSTGGFVGIAQTMMTSFTQAISNALPTVQTTINQWVTTVLNTFKGNSKSGINEQVFKGYATEITNSFLKEIQAQAPDIVLEFKNLATDIGTEFTSVASYDTWKGYGQDIVQGAIDGVNAKAPSLISAVRKLAADVNAAFNVSLDIGSPSKVFEESGMWIVEGLTRGITDNQEQALNAVRNMGNLMVDTSKSIAQTDYSSVGVNSNGSYDYMNNAAVEENGFEQAMVNFYNNYMMPQMTQLVDNTQRQADKNESVTVQIGNQEVANAVKQQQRANGYSFIRG